jgi:hypothetical protein
VKRNPFFTNDSRQRVAMRSDHVHPSAGDHMAALRRHPVQSVPPASGLRFEMLGDQTENAIGVSKMRVSLFISRPKSSCVFSSHLPRLGSGFLIVRIGGWPAIVTNSASLRTARGIGDAS